MSRVHLLVAVWACAGTRLPQPQHRRRPSPLWLVPLRVVVLVATVLLLLLPPPMPMSPLVVGSVPMWLPVSPDLTVPTSAALITRERCPCPKRACPDSAAAAAVERVLADAQGRRFGRRRGAPRGRRLVLVLVPPRALRRAIEAKEPGEHLHGGHAVASLQRPPPPHPPRAPWGRRTPRATAAAGAVAPRASPTGRIAEANVSAAAVAAAAAAPTFVASAAAAPAPACSCSSAGGGGGGRSTSTRCAPRPGAGSLIRDARAKSCLEPESSRTQRNEHPPRPPPPPAPTIVTTTTTTTTGKKGGQCRSVSGRPK